MANIDNESASEIHYLILQTEVTFPLQGVQCYKKKSIFPSKMRLLKFILPGVVLACSGLIFNLALETQENYKYLHSAWHILVSASIMFLLPPRRNNKGYLFLKFTFVFTIYHIIIIILGAYLVLV